MNARDTIAAALKGEGCLGHAAPDEEVFVLRAKDRFFVATLSRWIELATSHGVNSAKTEDAVAVLNRANRWREANGVKVPD